MASAETPISCTQVLNRRSSAMRNFLASPVWRKILFVAVRLVFIVLLIGGSLALLIDLGLVDAYLRESLWWTASEAEPLATRILVALRDIVAFSWAHLLLWWTILGLVWFG